MAKKQRTLPELLAHSVELENEFQRLAEDFANSLGIEWSEEDTIHHKRELKDKWISIRILVIEGKAHAMDFSMYREQFLQARERHMTLRLTAKRPPQIIKGRNSRATPRSCTAELAIMLLEQWTELANEILDETGNIQSKMAASLENLTK